MEPVEIDIRMKQNVTEEGKKAAGAINDMDEAAGRAATDVKAKIAEQKSIIKQIETDIASIQKLYEQAAPGRTKMSMGQELGAAKQALDEEKNALIELEGKVEVTAQKHTMLRTEVMNAKDEVARLEMAGKRGGDEWVAATAKLGGLNDQMKDTNQIANILADDEKKFKAVASGVAGIAGAMSAAVGVASLFGAEQEELAKIQTRLQSVMAITIGLQQVAEALNKDSYFSVVLLTKAKAGWAAAQTFLNTQLGIGVGLSRALMVSGIGLLIAGIGSLILLYQSWSDKQAEVTKAQEEFNKAVADGASKPIAAIKELSAEWNALGDNMEAKKKFITDNKNKFDELGWSVSDVTEAERILSDPQNLQNFIDAQEYKAKAIAATQLAAEKYKQALVKQLEWEKTAPKTQWKLFGINIGTTDNSKYSRLNKEKVDLNEEGDNLIKVAGDNTNQANHLLNGLNIKPPAKTVKDKKDNKEKEKKEAYDAEKELQEMLVGISATTNKLLIDQKQDGLEKRLAEIDSEKKEEIGKIDEMQQDIVDAYNKSHKGEKGFTEAKKIEDVPGIKPDTLKAIEAEKTKITTAADAKRKQAREDSAKEMADLARKYAGEEVNIRYDYQQDIDKLTADGNTDAANAAKAERDKRISELTAEVFTGTELYKTAMDEKLLASKEATEALISDTKRRIEALVLEKKLTRADADKMIGDLDKTNVSREQSKSENNPFAQLIDGIKAYKAAKKDLANKKDTASADDLVKLEAASKKSLKSVAGTAAGALDATGQIIGTTVGALDSLGLMSEEQKKDAQDVIGMVGGAASIAKGIATGNPVDIITGSVNLLASAISLFDKKSKDIAKKQKEHKKNIADLERAYTQLQYAVDKALGTDVYAAQRREIENSKKQIAEYEAWIVQERRKKKKKQDQEAIKDAQAKIQELKNSITDQVQAITESLAQTSAKDLASNLADALVSAFQTGEDAATAMGNVINDVLKNAVVNSLKLKFLEKPLNDAVNYLGSAMGDGELSEAEKKVFGSMVTTAGNNFNNALAAYDEILGATDAARAGASKGIATASQDSIDELNGGVYAMRSGVADIRNYERENLLITRTMTGQLGRIVDNTEFCRHLEGISRDINDMKIKGITVKV